MSPIGRLRSTLRQILHLNESPQRTALAFALGVFIAFSPTYGLHTISALACAWALRLNVVAVLGGSLINNPWTVVPIIGLTFFTGFTLTGTPMSTPIAWEQLRPETLYQAVAPYLLPFVVGGLALGIAGGVTAYLIALWLITRVRAAQPGHDCGPLPPELR